MAHQMIRGLKERPNLLLVPPESLPYYEFESRKGDEIWIQSNVARDIRTAVLEFGTSQVVIVPPPRRRELYFCDLFDMFRAFFAATSFRPLCASAASGGSKEGLMRREGVVSPNVCYVLALSESRQRVSTDEIPSLAVLLWALLHAMKYGGIGPSGIHKSFGPSDGSMFLTSSVAPGGGRLFVGVIGETLTVDALSDDDDDSQLSIPRVREVVF